MNPILALDTHIDIPWPPGAAFETEGPRRVDLPKMRRGGIAGGCFAAYIPQAQLSAASEAAAFARAEAMLEAINAMGQAEHATLASSARAIEAAYTAGRTAVIPAVENGFAVGQDLAHLRRFAALGARYLTLTHNGHNALADAAIPRPDFGDGREMHGGLSPLGRAAVAEMNRLGMLVDVSHAAKSTMLQAAALSRTPVVATHSCVRALCDHPRNLDDEQLDVLRDTGGVVQITAVSGFIKRHADEKQVTLADFIGHVDYVVRRIGIEHVGIGSDFDGGGGFTGWHDISASPNLTAALREAGYDDQALRLIWGGNFIRLLRRAEALT